jgi:hypothetical protein
MDRQEQFTSFEEFCRKYYPNREANGEQSQEEGAEMGSQLATCSLAENAARVKL